MDTPEVGQVEEAVATEGCAGGGGLKPRNSFRDEAEKETLSAQEIGRRNQNIHLLQLRARKEMVAADRCHITGAIRRMELALKAFSLMQDCEMKETSMEGCSQQIEGLKQQLSKTELGDINAITLAALEELMRFRAEKETIED